MFENTSTTEDSFLSPDFVNDESDVPATSAGSTSLSLADLWERVRRKLRAELGASR